MTERYYRYVNEEWAFRENGMLLTREACMCAACKNGVDTDDYRTSTGWVKKTQCHPPTNDAEDLCGEGCMNSFELWECDGFEPDGAVTRCRKCGTVFDNYRRHDGSGLFFTRCRCGAKDGDIEDISRLRS